MKFCPNCGYQMEDDAIFCENCGEKWVGFEEPGYADSEETVSYDYDHPERTNYINKWEDEPTPYQNEPTQQYTVKSNNNNNTILIAIVIALLVVIIGGGGYFIFFRSSNSTSNTNNTTEEVTEDISDEDDDDEEDDDDTITSENQQDTTTTTSSDYILANSNTQYLTSSDISGLTTSQLRLARNEIYARHGYIFKDTQLSNYFKTKSWYNPTYTSQTDVSSQFNDYEKKNVSFLKKAEKGEV